MVQMSEARIAELYGELVNYICEDLSDLGEIRETLRGIGFTDEELEYEGLFYDFDEEE